MAGKTAALVPKGPTAPPPPPSFPDFDRDTLLARLFALPVPPITRQGRGGGGREYPIHTPLGRIMRLRGLTVNEMSMGEGCPNVRVMSDYLANRKPMAPHHRVALGRLLRVDPRIF